MDSEHALTGNERVRAALEKLIRLKRFADTWVKGGQEEVDGVEYDEYARSLGPAWGEAEAALAAPREDVEAKGNRSLRRLVDLTWQHVTQSHQVPSTDAAYALIDHAISGTTPVSQPGFDESWREPPKPRPYYDGVLQGIQDEVDAKAWERAQAQGTRVKFELACELPDGRQVWKRRDQLLGAEGATEPEAPAAALLKTPDIQMFTSQIAACRSLLERVEAAVKPQATKPKAVAWRVTSGSGYVHLLKDAKTAQAWAGSGAEVEELGVIGCFPA